MSTGSAIHIYISCSEGEIYLDHSWKSLIMAIYLESGIFYCKYLQGVGSLIVPSCSPALRNSPGPVMKNKRVFLTRVRKMSTVQIVFMSYKLCSQNNKCHMKGFGDIFGISNNAVYLFQAFSKIPGATVK